MYLNEFDLLRRSDAFKLKPENAKRILISTAIFRRAFPILVISPQGYEPPIYKPPGIQPPRL